MKTESRNLLERIRGVKTVQPFWEEIDAWAEAGDCETLVDAAFALGSHQARSADQWAVQSLWERILSVLALYPKTGFAEAAIRQAMLPDPDGQDRRRRVAQMLGAGQSVESLVALFAQLGAEEEAREILACVLQEMVLRGVDGTNVPTLRDFEQRLVADRHPLGWLPLKLQPIESGLGRYLPQFAKQSSNHAIAGFADQAPYKRVSVKPERLPSKTFGATFHDITTPEIAARLGLAVRNWAEDSNGVFEIRGWAVDPPLPVEAIDPRLLASLNLASLGKVSATESDMLRVDSARVLDILFAASCNGGAYNRGRRGAYGRLEAWKSLGALAGTTKSSTAEEVRQQAEQCDWFTFDAEAGWFAHVAWDVGILCLQPGGTVLTLLAATDED